VTIGERLKEERERLDFTQPAFAGLAETTKKSQIDYEKDLTQPKAGYLAAIAKVGADVQYIVTGERRGSGLGEAAVHQAVIDAVDLLSLDKKVDASQLAKAVVKLCAKSGAASTTPPQQHFEGGQQIFHQAPTGEFAARDIIKGKASKGK